MHAQVVRVQFQPGKVDEAISIFRESVLPAVKERPGYKASYLLVDRDHNRGVGLSVYETEADLEAVVASGFYQEQVAKFASVFATPPERAVYEVAVHP